MELTILQNLAETIRNPIGLATLIGMLAYGLFELAKGNKKIDALNKWNKRAIVGFIGALLGVAFTLPISNGLAVWPDGILAGLIGSLAMATARGLGQTVKSNSKSGASLMMFVIGLVGFVFEIGCGGLQICDDPTLVLRDGKAASETTVVFQCGGHDIASQVIPVGDLAGFDLCENPTVSLQAAAQIGQSSIVIDCGGVTLMSFLVDTNYFKSSGTSSASIVSATSSSKTAKVRMLRINGGCHGNR